MSISRAIAKLANDLARSKKQVRGLKGSRDVDGTLMTANDQLMSRVNQYKEAIIEIQKKIDEIKAGPKEKNKFGEYDFINEEIDLQKGQQELLRRLENELEEQGLRLRDVDRELADLKTDISVDLYDPAEMADAYYSRGAVEGVDYPERTRPEAEPLTSDEDLNSRLLGLINRG